MRALKQNGLLAGGIAATAPTIGNRLHSALWVAIGVLWIALCLYGWGSWITSETAFRPVPLGADIISASSLFWIRIIEWASIPVSVWMAWAY